MTVLFKDKMLIFRSSNFSNSCIKNFPFSDLYITDDIAFKHPPLVVQSIHVRNQLYL